MMRNQPPLMCEVLLKRSPQEAEGAECLVRGSTFSGHGLMGLKKSLEVQVRAGDNQGRWGF